MGDKPIISNNIVQPNKGTNLVLKNKPCHKIKAQTIDSHKKAEPRQRTAAMVQQSFLNQTYRLLACKWCSLCVGAGTKLFVEHIQAVAVVANHLQVVDDVLCGFFLFYLTGFVAADLTRMAVFPLLGHSLPSTVPAFFETLFGRSDSLITINGEAVSRALWVQIYLLATLGMILTHACYLVGSALLRKNVFVLTSLALFALAVAAGWVTVELAGARFELFTSVDDTWQLACLNAVLFVLIVGCYWLTWRRFTRIQVVGRKWLRP